MNHRLKAIAVILVCGKLCFDRWRNKCRYAFQSLALTRRAGTANALKQRSTTRED